MIQERFIYFDEPNHKYSDNYGNHYTSVTTVLGKFENKFDDNYWANKKALEQKTSAAVIKSQWKNINKVSTDNGNKKHGVMESGIKDTSKFSNAVNYITTASGIKRCFSVYDIAYNAHMLGGIGEMSLNQFYTKVGHKYPIIYDTIKYYVERGYRIYSEIVVYDPFNLICGTIDVLLVKDDQIVIIDWKTNRNDIAFTSGYWKKDKPTNELTNIWVPKNEFMKYPVDNLPDCVGIHYTLQLSLYANLVEGFNYNLNAMILFHIRDSYILNQWGKPRKDERGLYIKDSTKGEYVEHHLIDYLKTDVEKIREYVGRYSRLQTQQKIIM